MLLEGKTCIIAGAGAPKGIGRATAELFAKHGANLVLADRSGIKQLAIDFRTEMQRQAGLNPAVIAIACDITDPQQCANLVARAEAEFGVIDVLLMIDINLKGAFNLCQAVLKHFVFHNSGAIVNLASLAAQRGGGLVGGAHYASAKGGVISLTRSIAREFGPLGIRANVVYPAMAQTGMLKGINETQLNNIRESIPLRRLALPIEVAGACLFLASELSSFVTGTTLDVNGGLHIR